MNSNIEGIKISEPLLQALMGEYISGLGKRKATKELALQIQNLWETDPAFYPEACSAIAAGVVLSTLACTAETVEDFEKEAILLAPIEDAIISAIRQEIFVAGVRCGVESIGHEHGTALKIGERMLVFEKATKLSQA